MHFSSIARDLTFYRAFGLDVVYFDQSSGAAQHLKAGQNTQQLD
jgi:hypothetical protein